MRGVFVAGTDTDVGKTRVCAAIASAWSALSPTVVKLVQTGVPSGEAGDAGVAAGLAGCSARELGRFAAPADPWSAALAEGREPLGVAELAAALQGCATPWVVEGSGGIAVPLNARETILDVAVQAGLAVVVVVGLRLGCINHAVLTAEYLRSRSIPIAGAVLVERWESMPASYHEDVRRAVAPHLPLIGTIAFEPDAAASVAHARRLFDQTDMEQRSFIPQS